MVKETLQRIIKATLPKLLEADVNNLVDHLTSPIVGVADEDDLKEISAADLSSLGSVQTSKLLKAFAKHGTETSNGSRATAVQQQAAHCSVGPIRVDRSVFSFTVPWDALPRDTIQNLDKAKREGTLADPKDRQNLKLAICKKLVAEYNAHKRCYPTRSKTPGLKIYENVTNQVFAKYRDCLKDIVNGNVVGDGTGGFQKSLKISVENKMREKTASTSERPSARRGKGTVGIIAEQYNPDMSDEDTEEQEKAMQKLSDIHSLRKTQWKHDEIRMLMHTSYGLQRKDIVNTTKKIQVYQDVNQDANADEFEQQEMQKLKEAWPFLFELEYLSQHCQILTGNLMELPLMNFIENNMANMITYLTSSGDESTIKNVALKKKWETSGQHDSTRLILAIMMVANHCGEETSMFFRTAEKTTLPLEIRENVQGLDGRPCLIALDNNIFEAQKFFPCVDMTVLSELDSASDALLYIFQSFFVFDAEYPSELLYTMEYLERAVFGLGLGHTRIRNRQQQIVTVISAKVQKLINSEKKFTDQLQAQIYGNH